MVIVVVVVVVVVVGGSGSSGDGSGSSSGGSSRGTSSGGSSNGSGRKIASKQNLTCVNILRFSAPNLWQQPFERVFLEPEPFFPTSRSPEAGASSASPPSTFFFSAYIQNQTNDLITIKCLCLYLCVCMFDRLEFQTNGYTRYVSLFLVDSGGGGEGGGGYLVPPPPPAARPRARHHSFPSNPSTACTRNI